MFPYFITPIIVGCSIGYTQGSAQTSISLPVAPRRRMIPTNSNSIVIKPSVSTSGSIKSTVSALAGGAVDIFKSVKSTVDDAVQMGTDIYDGTLEFAEDVWDVMTPAERQQAILQSERLAAQVSLLVLQAATGYGFNPAAQDPFAGEPPYVPLIA